MRLISGLVMAAAVAASVSGCALEDVELQIDELTGQLAVDEGAGGERAQHGAVVTAAAREPDPPGCNDGAFCAYSDMFEEGTLLLERQGNWAGSISGVMSVYNNGVRWTGADHVDLDWNFGGNAWRQCIHYNPGPGHRIDFIGVQIVKVRWRDECKPGEDKPHPRPL
jgi:hypothetical protein